MRIRQVKPSFWSDAHISDLHEPTRLFYIGLWMLADDAGWIRWDTREVAHELYGYESVRRRESKVDSMLAELLEHGRVRQYDCGHVEVPTLSQHQRLAGATKQVKTVLADHQKRCLSPIPAAPRTSPQSLATERNGKERLGTVRNGSARGARIKEGETTDFGERMAAAGVRIGADETEKVTT
jgi:hypothetical protein